VVVLQRGSGASTWLDGSAEDKLRWAFRLYDVDDDSTVSRQEIVNILKVPSCSHRTVSFS